MSSGSEALLVLRESGLIMELSRRANCEICISELFQGESDEATKFYDGSIVLGQFCSQLDYCLNSKDLNTVID